MRKYASVVVLMLGLTACGAAQAVPFADVCQPTNDQKRLSTEGYFAVGSSVFCSNIGSSTVQCGFDFADAPGSSTVFSADLDRGDGDNHVEVPEDFTEETIIIHDDKGAKVPFGTKARISGKMLIEPTSKVCLMNVDTIEQVP